MALGRVVNDFGSGDNFHGIYNDTEAALAYINEKGMESVDDLEKYTISSLNL